MLRRWENVAKSELGWVEHLKYAAEMGLAFEWNGVGVESLAGDVMSSTKSKCTIET
jgi:hypothetical protein